MNLFLIYNSVLVRHWRKCRLNNYHKHNILQFSSYPYLIWVVGFAIFLLGLYLFYHITLGKYYGTLIGYYVPPKFFHYFMALGIIVLGGAFIEAGRIEKIEFNKKVIFIQNQ